MSEATGDDSISSSPGIDPARPKNRVATGPNAEQPLLRHFTRQNPEFVRYPTLQTE